MDSAETPAVEKMLIALAAAAAAGRSERNVERRKSWNRVLEVIFEFSVRVVGGVQPAAYRSEADTLE